MRFYLFMLYFCSMSIRKVQLKVSGVSDIPLTSVVYTDSFRIDRARIIQTINTQMFIIY